MATSTLYLLRHAEAAPSSHLDEANWPLSSSGRIQAQMLVRELRRRVGGHSRVVSSPNRRALDTVQPYCESQGLSVEIEPDIRELKLSDDVDIDFEAAMGRLWEDFDYTHPGGESFRSCQSRMVACVERIGSASANRAILSSHGAAISLFLNHIDPSFGVAGWQATRNPDLFKIHFDGTGFHWDRTFRM